MQFAGAQFTDCNYQHIANSFDGIFSKWAVQCPPFPTLSLSL